jgi:hypothetical protein
MTGFKPIFLFTFLTAFLSSTLWSQEVVASDGDFNQSPQGSLSWTLGEMITETVANGSGTFTQGFQQNYEQIMGIATLPALANPEVYPNPFSQEVFISLEDANDWIQIAVHDVSGRILFDAPLYFSAGLAVQKINLSEFLPGTYFLRIEAREQSESLTFPIIKSY